MNLSTFNPFKYSLAEVSPLIVSVVFLIGYGVTLFVAVPGVGFVPAVAALVPAVFAVVEVFTKAAPSAEDLSKALKQLQGAGTAVVAYFILIPADTTNKIGILIGAIVSFFAVAWAHAKISKKPPIDDQRHKQRPGHSINS